MTDPATIEKIAHLAVVCVNTHDRCEGCEPTVPLRDADTGRFATAIKGAMKDE